MRAAVRWNVKHGADVIKVCATGGVMSLNNDVDSPQLTQDEMNAQSRVYMPTHVRQALMKRNGGRP